MEFEYLKLLFGDDLYINDHIKVHNPTLQEIYDYGEENYWGLVQSLCATPANLKWQLFDRMHLYYDEVEELDVFSMMCKRIPQSDSKILFGDLNFQELQDGINPQNGEHVLFSETSNVVIDFRIFLIITDYIRKLHAMVKDLEPPGNESTRDFMIELAREDYEKYKNQPFKSVLAPFISFVVNAKEQSYNYDTVRNLHISQLIDAVNQIQQDRSADHAINGMYAGTLDLKKINKKELKYFREL